MSSPSRHPHTFLGNRPPVIVAGAHRSGTTLVVRLLERLGVFMGAAQEPNGEPYFFTRLNEWVLRRASGAWDRPQPAVEFLSDPHVAENARALLERRVHSASFAEFTGLRRYLQTLGARRNIGPWGWKDPRNTITFDLWCRIFPGASLLLIERNGIDAAQSLVVRQQRARERAGDDMHLEMSPMPRAWGQLWRRKDRLQPYVTFSARCREWRDAFGLWEEYVRGGRRIHAAHQGPKHRIRYESLLEDPVVELTRLVDFLQLSVPYSQVETLASEIRSDRRCAFQHDTDLMEAYTSVRESEWMRTLEYDSLIEI
ncbi:MAG: sulfotransferase [Planctomycetota bacterium]